MGDIIDFKSMKGGAMPVDPTCIKCKMCDSTVFQLMTYGAVCVSCNAYTMDWEEVISWLIKHDIIKVKE